jgi:hypothetical protein
MSVRRKKDSGLLPGQKNERDMIQADGGRCNSGRLGSKDIPYIVAGNKNPGSMYYENDFMLY